MFGAISLVTITNGLRRDDPDVLQQTCVNIEIIKSTSTAALSKVQNCEIHLFKRTDTAIQRLLMFWRKFLPGVYSLWRIFLHGIVYIFECKGRSFLRYLEYASEGRHSLLFLSGETLRYQ